NPIFFELARSASTHRPAWSRLESKSADLITGETAAVRGGDQAFPRPAVLRRRSVRRKQAELAERVRSSRAGRPTQRTGEVVGRAAGKTKAAAAVPATRAPRGSSNLTAGSDGWDTRERSPTGAFLRPSVLLVLVCCAVV